MVISLVFFPEKSHGQRSLEIYSPWGCKRVGHAERLHFCTSQEELPYVQGQGQRPRVPDCDGAGKAEKSYPTSEVRGAADRRYPASEVRGGGREELPNAPTPKARGDGQEELPHAPMPEVKGGGQEEQPHARGQGRWLGGPTPRPRSHGCTGTGGPRGAIPR